jgi:hypothetical protein
LYYNVICSYFPKYIVEENMRKYLMILVALLALSISTFQLFAQTTVFHQNDQVVIKKGISYAWIRDTPTSECACVVVAISSSKQILRILDSTPVSDGIQNWWHVTTTTGTLKQGWIEEQSLTLYKTAPPANATISSTQQPRQFSSAEVQIRDGVSFIWLRGQPSSSSDVVNTINFFRPTTRSQCLTLGTVPGTVKWDGQQWWRYINSSSDSSSGWVEEKSLVDCKPTTSSSAVIQPTVSPSDSSNATPLPSTSTNAAYEPFERGIMLWRQDTQVVYVFMNGSGYTIFPVDSYNGLASPIDTPPSGRYTPVNGFGKVWNGQNYFGSLIRDTIGWATAPEQGYTAQLSAYVVASAAKPNTRTTMTLPNGRSISFDSAFNSWAYN